MSNENGSKPGNTDTKAEQDSTEVAAPKYMTVEEINGALTARERRSEQRLAKQMEEFQQRIASMLSAKQPDGDEASAEAGKGAQESPEVKKLAAKLEAMNKQRDAEKAEAAKERAEFQAKQERSDVLSALSAAGSPNAIGAYSHLKLEGRLTRNAAGELVMRVMKEYGEDEVPVVEGIKLWLETAEGKHYAPPRGGGEGSGTVIRGGAPRNGKSLSKDEAKREAQSLLTKFILGGG